MLFSAYLGSEPGSAAWREATIALARWLGAHLEFERYDAGATSLLIGRLQPGPRPGDRRPACVPEYVIVTSSGSGPQTARERDRADRRAAACARTGNQVSLHFRIEDASVAMVVPPATPHQFYFARSGEGYVLADDLRLFSRLLEPALDERAVYALFQYGTIPPPLTLYREVQRVPGGCRLRVRPGQADPQWEVLHRTAAGPGTDAGGADAEGCFVKALDGALSGVPPGAALYFSGGVDSGLLAARFAEQERRDVRLINVRFGPRDQESDLALRMAGHLGLRCEQVTHDARQVPQVLERIGKEYSFPFGDLSTLPTNVLVHASLAQPGLPLAVVEGTGADGAFGVGAKYDDWRRLYSVPPRVRRAVSGAYRRMGLWKHASRWEHLGRVARKSTWMRLGPAMVAENALDGIAYTMPTGVRAELDQTIQGHLELTSSGAPPAERLSQLDLAWVCAGRMAPKSFDPLRARGVQPVYPFLEPAVLHASARLSWEEKCPAGEPKGLLKRVLSRSVPRDWVYRPKSGFIPSQGEIFASHPMQQFLRDFVLSERNPLAPFLRARTVASMVARAGQQQPVCPGVHEFLWTLAFSSAWLAQQRELGGTAHS